MISLIQVKIRGVKVLLKIISVFMISIVSYAAINCGNQMGYGTYQNVQQILNEASAFPFIMSEKLTSLPTKLFVNC